MKQRKRRAVKVDGTYDIECASWDRPVLCVSHHRTNGTMIHDTVGDMVARMRDLGGVWWAHNGGEYDALAVIDEMERQGVPMNISLSGSRVSRAVGGGLTLCDSYAVIPLGLEVAAQLAGMEAASLGWPCTCGRDCGGYCGITVKLSRPKRAQLASYCVNDAEVLMAALDAIGEFCEAQDFDLRGTIGGSAWATAQRVLGLPDAEYPSSTWNRIRNGYQGGRVTVFRARAGGPGRHWDLTSAYPAALQNLELPVGEPVEYGARRARELLDSGSPGIYACTVMVPEMHVPPLGIPTRSGNAYLVGKVSGAWTLIELQAAMERGVTVADVSWGVVWPGTAPVFRSIMRTWTDLRLRLGKGSAWGAWMRLWCNSVTGKLAESPHHRMVRANPEPGSIRMCLGAPPCTPIRCSGACDMWRQLDRWGRMWSVPFYRQATSGHIQWAAYCTAATRVALLDGLESQGDQVVYCDTDSVWTVGRKRPYPHGEALGEWALKGEWRDWECAAPKSYIYTDVQTGIRHAKSSGARIDPSEWRHGEAQQDRGVLSLIDAARSLDRQENTPRGLFRAKRHVWTLPSRGMETGWYGDRVLDTLTGVTHPVTNEQLRRTGQEAG